jgi:uroporphyrinogen decarboxylase
MEDKLLNCIKQKDLNYVPIWFMRQAGRYLPEFREIRSKNKDFLKLCFNPELSTEISLQPLKRFDLDAAIIFSDILTVPYGLNQNVNFIKGEGPILEDLDLHKALNTTISNFSEKLKPSYNAIKLLKKKLPKNKSLIGFLGAPWTLLVYMFHKKSPKKQLNLKEFLKKKLELDEVLEKLVKILCVHIDNQINAGANIIQIFDSWAGLLDENYLNHYCYEPTIKLTNHIKNKNIPVICFPKGIGKNYVQFIKKVKPDCISIDYNINPEWAKDNFENIPIQGGLDPKILLKNNETIKMNVLKYLNIFKNYPYIFNLGHGVLPETKPEAISKVIEIIKKK